MVEAPITDKYASDSPKGETLVIPRVKGLITVWNKEDDKRVLEENICIEHMQVMRP